MIALGIISANIKNQVSLTKILMRHYNYIFPFIIFGRYILIKFNIYLEAGFFVNF